VEEGRAGKLEGIGRKENKLGNFEEYRYVCRE
jgi:hypothetical protein